MVNQAPRLYSFPDVRRLFDIFVAIQVTMALVLLVIYLTFEPPTGFRFAGPASLAILAVVLTNGVFAGIWRFAVSTIPGAGSTPRNPAQDLYPQASMVPVTRSISLPARRLGP
jgi:hypothetical protein